MAALGAALGATVGTALPLSRQKKGLRLCMASNVGQAELNATLCHSTKAVRTG
jgi:hypothetical protein